MAFSTRWRGQAHDPQADSEETSSDPYPTASPPSPTLQPSEQKVLHKEEGTGLQGGSSRALKVQWRMAVGSPARSRPHPVVWTHAV